MLYDLRNELEIKGFQAKCDYLISQGKKVEIKERRKARTINQNRYLHLIFGLYASETGYTVEEVKQDIFKREICFDVFMIIKKGRQVFRSTASLDTKEMTIVIDMFRNHASKDLGIYLPEPNEDLRSLEEHLEKYGNRQYI